MWFSKVGDTGDDEVPEMWMSRIRAKVRNWTAPSISKITRNYLFEVVWSGSFALAVYLFAIF